MPITLSENVLRLLPTDVDEAKILVNEILEQVLLSRNETPDRKLENRPDWQTDIQSSREEWAKGKTVSHEDVLHWHRAQAVEHLENTTEHPLG